MTHHDHFIIACSPHLDIWVLLLFFVPIPFVVNCAFSACLPRGCNNNIPSFVQLTTTIAHFLWMLHLTWLSHPGHSTILLQLESPSGKHANLHIVTASNKKDRMPWSLITCLCHLHMGAIHYPSHKSCSLWIAHSMPCQLRSSNNTRCVNPISAAHSSTIIVFVESSNAGWTFNLVRRPLWEGHV